MEPNGLKFLVKFIIPGFACCPGGFQLRDFFHGNHDSRKIWEGLLIL
jgi:hypothetical protein